MVHQSPADLEAQTAAKASRVDVASPIDYDLAVVVHNFTNSREEVRRYRSTRFPTKMSQTWKKTCNAKECGRPRTSPDGNEVMHLTLAMASRTRRAASSSETYQSSTTDRPCLEGYVPT